MTSIILAGGKGTRLGRDKLREVVGGDVMLQRVIDRLASVNDEILVVVAQGQDTPVLPEGARVLVDLYPAGGALGGLYTGLLASSSFHCLAVAGDMPFLNPSLLGYMMHISPGNDIVIPRIGERLEPLHAVYSKDCLDILRQQIEQGKRSLQDFVKQVSLKHKVRYVEEAEIDRFDPEHLSFFNINTPADLEKAKMLAEKLG